MIKFKVDGYIVVQDGGNIFFTKNNITLARMRYVGTLTKEEAENMVREIKGYLINVETINKEGAN